ncbi:MAG: hypothetical protein ACRDQ6_21395 [Pseudonocardiaceae bacterium]
MATPTNLAIRRPAPNGTLDPTPAGSPAPPRYLPRLPESLVFRWKLRGGLMVVQYALDSDGRRREVLTWLHAHDVRRSPRLPAAGEQGQSSVSR